MRAYTWQEPEPGAVIDWAQVTREIKEATQHIIKQAEDGDVEVFFGDGIHKLYEPFLHKVTAGISAVSLDFDAKLYESARRMFMGYIGMVQRAPFKRVVWTVWDGREKDDPTDQAKNAPTHIYPDLPGKLAKLIMGEVPIVLYASVQGVGEGAQYRWQVRPFGKVWGCGIKGDVEVTKHVPTYVPQDWAKLAALLGCPLPDAGASGK